jgi:hypothetical protein
VILIEKTFSMHDDDLFSANVDFQPLFLFALPSSHGLWIFFFFKFASSFQLHYRVYSVSNRNEYQESFWKVKGSRCIRFTISAPSVSRLSSECGILNVS